tara:strand:- start:71 stop:379 length:309 start_codon:yes stop_codon:yes gene_type:complete
MPFTPGDENINKNGRPKGSKNKISEEIRTAFQLVLENKLPDLERWLQQTAQDDPAKAIDLMIKLSNRFVPELSRQELTGADGADLFKNIKFDFGDDKGTEPS